jgi:uncharacterized protein (DUF433 family)
LGRGGPRLATRGTVPYDPGVPEFTDRIVVTPGVCHGKPHVRGTRILVSQVLDLIASGVPAADIRADDWFPDLAPEDVQACLDYAAALVRGEDVLIAPTAAPG